MNIVIIPLLARREELKREIYQKKVNSEMALVFKKVSSKINFDHVGEKFILRSTCVDKEMVQSAFQNLRNEVYLEDNSTKKLLTVKEAVRRIERGRQIAVIGKRYASGAIFLPEYRELMEHAYIVPERINKLLLVNKERLDPEGVKFLHKHMLSHDVGVHGEEIFLSWNVFQIQENKLAIV